MIKKLLIANRGEIACRVIRTARKMGIETVAIYSDIDKDSRHVQMADKAYNVGPAPSAQSYLNAAKILEIAHHTGAQAIHPGFGFLSENAKFADTVANEGLIFVGPPSKSIVAMGSKSESKKIMEAAKVPVVKGYHGDNQDPEFLLNEAKKIGFPVLIKAVSGGGGKGMRIVNHESEFFENLDSAKRESLKSFSDDKVLVEKYITRPRHIEVQVFGDKHDNYVYLFERDCSIQRRNQKVVEEAPSNIDEQLRAQIGQSAVDAARAVGYYNAGTVEFIFDVDANTYYFMEMNTRLQVEHPITEMITGQDLVEWQLLVASGYPLPKKQKDLYINGHSIEVRVYSEDPYNNFLPGSGKISYMREPQEVEGLVRMETGVRQNDEISIFYDPMIAKLVVWGKDRLQASQRLSHALQNFKIAGLVNNVPFLKTIIDDEQFKSWDYDTSYIPKNKDALLTRSSEFDQNSLVSSLLLHAANNLNSELPSSFVNFRVNSALTRTVNFEAKLVQSPEEALKFTATIKSTSKGTYDVSVKSDKQSFELRDITLSRPRDHFVTIAANKDAHTKEYFIQGNKYTIFEDSGDAIEITFPEDKARSNAAAAGEENKNSIKAPMPGTLVKLLVKPGDKVAQGTPLVVLEAMKMEHTMKAPRELTIKAINYKEGSFVEGLSTLLTFE